jgi:1-acyl-sn-glycerol-3-phosphate acyltransferase
MEKILIKTFIYFRKNRLVFLLTLGICFIVPGYFALQIKFEEDIAKVLPKDKKIEKLTEVFQNSKFSDRLVVMVSLKDTLSQVQPDYLVNYADALIEQLQQNKNSYIRKINGKVEDSIALSLFNSVTDNLPIYLEEKDYETIDSLIIPRRIKETLLQNIKTLNSPASFALKNIISSDPTGISMLGIKKLKQIQYDENFELYENYVITKNKKYLLIFITPTFPPNNTGKNALMLEYIDSIIQRLNNSEFKKVNATYFGATAVSVGNALQLRKDTLLTQGITLIFIIVFLSIYFRKRIAPLLIMMPVMFGVIFSLAVIFIIKGSISVVALGTGCIVLGIAVNYSLHVFNHFKHINNIQQVVKDLALPLTVGSFTTVGGFFCLEFVESEILKDLGLFAAFSLIGASFFSLVYLPHFIVSKKEPSNSKLRRFSFIDKISMQRPEQNNFLIIAIIIITIFLGYWSNSVGFESDLNKMNFMSEKLKLAEKELNTINQYSLQSIYLVTEGTSLNDALIKNERLNERIQKLETDGVIKKHSGVSTLIISDSLQKLRIDQWRKYWTKTKKTALLNTLHKEGEELKYSSTAFNKFNDLINKNFEVLDNTKATVFRKLFLDEYITEKENKTSIVTLLKVAAENKSSVYKSLENEQSTTLLDKQYLIGRLVQLINDDFTSIAIMTSLLVFFALLIMYGRIELTLVSFIPMFISWVWILGIMGITSMKFNIINIIISALIFGLGDDYSLFIMDGLLQEYKTGKKNLSSFKSSILLSAITTIAGLGVLIFAKHPALRSIALISIVGILCVVIMSQILIPFLFTLLIKNRVKTNLFPWTLFGFLKSAFAFSLFISVSIFFTFLGKLFSIIGVKERGKYLYHLLISKACNFLVFVMVNVKKRVINTFHEDFTNPAIIICNHQSSLDIVPLIMLHPKILMLTNNKKWNAPFFGAVIQMAEYFPADQIDQHLDKVADRINQGYSVVIFPEGTRSETGEISRFHKGAFYLSEKLNVDILPIVIHGTNYTLTKKDTLLKNGSLTLKYLPRIKPTDLSFGDNYVDRAKTIGNYFRKEFELLKNENEQTSYFREKLIYNFIYKGPLIEWYMRIKTKIENNYQIFNELIPHKNKILDIGCGYGFMSYMLHFTSNKRFITGIDYDEEKIETANHCFSKSKEINFIHSDVLSFEFEIYDTIILSDILHYLQPEEQTLVIKKCIDNLNEEGILIIRDGNKDDRLKHKRTVLTEIFSTKVFNFNKVKDTGLSFFSGNKIRETAFQYNMDINEISNSKITSNTIFVLKKNDK